MAERLFWEELNAGDTAESLRRTVTEADVVNFCGVSGDFNWFHIDDVGAKAAQQCRVLPEGALQGEHADPRHQAPARMAGEHPAQPLGLGIGFDELDEDQRQVRVLGEQRVRLRAAAVHLEAEDRTRP